MTFESSQLRSAVLAAREQPLYAAALLVAIAVVSLTVQKIVYRLFLHPLVSFPGPKVAAATTKWKAYVECIQNRSFCHVLEELHATYGDVVRVGPNELHFANPKAYHEIYNNRNRWDKERKLYHSFGEDRSSFGFLTYKESKERKDVLNKMFSAKAVGEAQGLIVEKIHALNTALKRESQGGKPADLFWAFRCMTMDIITYLCFGASVDATNEPGFRAPIMESLDASLPVMLRFKHWEFYKNMIMSCPPNISKVVSPDTKGLVDMQQMIKRQVSQLTQHPEKIAHLPHNMTIYHQLMDKEAYRNGTVPCEGSLYEETQALMIAGSDTTGNALMVGTFHMLRQPETYAKFKQEIVSVWEKNGGQDPPLRDLETLPYLTAVIKESLRLSSGVVAGLPRIVPKEGATIVGVAVPGGTIVSCGSTFVHFNPELFPNPQKFRPERWIENPDLDQWMVAFSRGPRQCLGINLAWMELRLSYAHVFREFDMTLAAGSPDHLEFRDCFLPCFLGPHVMAHITESKGL